MNKDEVSNLTIRQMIDIDRLSGFNRHYFQLRKTCPFCGEFAMFLREKDASFLCTECGEEGSLDKLEFELTRRLSQERSAVDL